MTYPRHNPAVVRPGRQPGRRVAQDMLLGAAAGAAGVWATDRVGWFLYNQEDRHPMARELQARRGRSDVEYTGPEKEALDRQPQVKPAGKDVAHGVAPVPGLASGPREYPWQAPARGAVAHLVLGVVTENALRLFNRVRAHRPAAAAPGHHRRSR